MVISRQTYYNTNKLTSFLQALAGENWRKNLQKRNKINFCYKNDHHKKYFDIKVFI
ncbi:hypothetical protein CJA_3239 [Cellvibrio japonicus Ueda107]|uniref:Uncharacterized protein n=1 Tax=Cellvibrio japonicus (strain Ueda107) TaxID=498211 RepID=B3PED7_CELJU|nr:hypothetical protein CJA_3239 [Cellvibrio japonicus Ueda107]